MVSPGVGDLEVDGSCQTYEMLGWCASGLQGLDYKKARLKYAGGGIERATDEKGACTCVAKRGSCVQNREEQFCVTMCARTRDGTDIPTRVRRSGVPEFEVGCAII